MKCFVPYGPCEVQKTEKWLNRQAAGGLHLTKAFGIMRASFSEEPIEETCYRLDVDNGKTEPDFWRRGVIEERGYQYVCTLGGNGLHVYRARPGCGELPDDPVIRKKAARRFLVYGSLYLLLEALYLGFCVVPPLVMRYPLLGVMQTSLWDLVVYALTLFLVIAVWGTEGAAAFRLGLKLARGPVSSWDHGKEPTVEKRKRVPYGVVVPGVILLLAVTAFLNLKDWRHFENLPEADPPVSFVDLKELEQENGFQVQAFYDRGSNHPDVNMSDQLQTMPVLFASSFYRTSQSGFTGTGQYLDHDTYMSLIGEYWTVSPEFLAETLFDQLVIRYTEYKRYHQSIFSGNRIDKDQVCRIEEREDSRFDELTLVRRTDLDDTLFVFARLGNQVASLEATGDLEADWLVEELYRVFEGAAH